jgi:surfeit locus 1 family protein
LTQPIKVSFPWGLTLAAALACLALIGLGAWQLKRLAWKEALLGEIASLAHAPARPIDTVLSESGPVAFRRVHAVCEPLPVSATTAYRYAVSDGRIAWRLLAACKIAASRFDGVLLDRGLVTRLTGLTAPVAASYPPPLDVVGVLRPPGPSPWLGPAMMDGGPGFVAMRVADAPSILRLGKLGGLSRPAPDILAVESERPAPAGVVPAAIPADIPNNHLVYALTWFALAAILAWFYLAMLITRYRR